jgi:alpha-1,2-mannosyltransferase
MHDVRYTLPSMNLRRWALVIAALVTLVIAVQERHRVVVRLQDPRGGHINDFDRWMIMTPGFLHDGANYVDDLLPTPPVSLLLLAPFSMLSRPNAQFVWACFKLPLAFLLFTISAGIVSRCGARLSLSAVALIVLCLWLPVIIDLQQGQINFVVLLPLFAGLWLAQNDSAGSDALAGTLIGLAAAIKVTPLIFAVYFFWKGRWVVAVAALASLAIFTLVVPAVAFGWDQNLRWLEQWMQIMIVPYVTRREVLYPVSQSFGSFALRLLSPVPVFETVQNGVPYGHYMNIVQLSESTVSQLVLGVMFVIGIAGLSWVRRALPTFKSPRYLVEIGGVTAFMLWFSERTWVHHYIAFVLTLCAAGATLSDSTQPSRIRRAIGAAMIVFALVSSFASEAGRVFGPHGVDWAKGVGVFLWPSILVTLATTRPWEDEWDIADAADTVEN